jgi:hypothetical protein
MNPDTLSALLQFLGMIIGSITGILVSTRLTTYRIEQLEKKVDKHNSVVERTYRLEERQNALYKRFEDHLEEEGKS